MPMEDRVESEEGCCKVINRVFERLGFLLF